MDSLPPSPPDGWVAPPSFSPARSDPAGPEPAGGLRRRWGRLPRWGKATACASALLAVGGIVAIVASVPPSGAHPGEQTAAAVDKAEHIGLGSGPGLPSGSVAPGAGGGAGAQLPSGSGVPSGSGGVPRVPVVPPAGGAHVPAKSPASSATRHTTKPADKPVTYANVAGLGCATGGASYAEYGSYTNGDAGWWTLGGGSYAGGGCDSRFTDMPMSGSGSDTSGQAIMWAFQVGSRAQSCALSLYVPTSSSARDVAAKNAHFAVVHGTTTGNTTYVDPSGDKFVNQSAHHQAWVSLGTFPVHNGMIGVKLTNRGSTSGYAMTYPHLAGGAVKIRCVAE